MRVAVVGKGGSGKSVITGTLARILARRGHRVLALDSDMQPGLALSLGAQVPDEPPLLAAAEQGENGRWHLRRGIGPARAVRRYATPAPDGVLLLQAGKATPEGLGPVLPAINAFYAVIHRLDRPVSLSSWTILGDLSAGPRQMAFDWAPYAERLLVVAEPTSQGMLTARRIARIAGTRQRDVELLVNKCTAADDAARVGAYVGLRSLGEVPLDEAVMAAERRGVAILDDAPEAPAVRAIERLAERLAGDSLSAVRPR